MAENLSFDFDFLMFEPLSSSRTKRDDNFAKKAFLQKIYGDVNSDVKKIYISYSKKYNFSLQRFGQFLKCPVVAYIYVFKMFTFFSYFIFYFF